MKTNVWILLVSYIFNLLSFVYLLHRKSLTLDVREFIVISFLIIYIHFNYRSINIVNYNFTYFHCLIC